MSDYDDICDECHEAYDDCQCTGICYVCNGSGEGECEKVRCYRCRGDGEINKREGWR